MSDSIKQIFIDAIRLEDFDHFINVFTSYYGFIKEAGIKVLQNISQKPALYSGTIVLEYWYDTQYSKDIIDFLLKTGRGLISYSDNLAWNISIETQCEDPFPAPKLDPGITNEELARRCWAPMKLAPVDISDDENFEIKRPSDNSEFEKQIEVFQTEIMLLNKQIEYLDNHNTSLVEMKEELQEKVNIVLQDNQKLKNNIKDMKIKFKDEKETLIQYKNDYYTDCRQYEKLYYDAVEYIRKLEKIINNN